jgi:predicted cupin superfamily sugar epimerase
MTEAGASINRRRALRSGVLALALSSPALASGARKKPNGHAMTSELTANEIVELLKLEPNATCGFVRVTYVSKLTLAAGALPAPFERSGPLGSGLYFLVTPEAPVRLHRIRNDQLYHYYLGDPLELFLLHADGKAEQVVVGPDLRAGQRVQLLIPGNTFHTARLLGKGRWFLGASTEWPGVVPADVEIGDLEQLAKQYPDAAKDLRAIAASVKEVKPAAPPR